MSARQHWRHEATANPVTLLSFVGGKRADGEAGRNFWNIPPNLPGFIGETLGTAMAQEYLDWQRQDGSESPALLPTIVKHMNGRMGAVEIAFLSLIEASAKRGGGTS